MDTRSLFVALTLLVAAAVAVGPDARAQKLSEEDEYFVIFNETVQISEQGGARDLSFEDTGFNLVRTNELIWIADPRAAGIQAIASRPIRDVAKAGETMGTRADAFAPRVVALSVTQDDAWIIDSTGMLYVMHKGWVDSVRVAPALAPEVDVAGSSNQLSYVLWGGEVRVYANPPGSAPLWVIALEDDLRPVVGLDVGSRGEVIVAGRGRTALAVYDLDDAGRWTQVRRALRADLDVGRLQGMCLSPGMLLPEPGREGWVVDHRFLFLADAERGDILALEAETFEVVGRQSVRKQVPFSAPARLSISNRGQIAFIDQNNDAAHVLPTSFTLSLVRSADFRWRLLDRPGKHRVRRPEDAPAPGTKAPEGG